MKRLIAFALAGSALVAPVGAGAFTRPTSSPTCSVAVLRAGGTAAIDRRLVFLGVLSRYIDAASHLQAAHRSTLKDRFTSDEDGLRALRTKIQGDSDCATLRQDVRSIVTGYRIYVLVGPQTRLTVVADRLVWVSSKLDDVAAKLQKAIDAAKARGKDVTAAQKALNDMKAQDATARTEAVAVPDKVLPLQPSGYPENRSVLLSSRDSLRSSRAHLAAAIRDAKAVVSAL